MSTNNSNLKSLGFIRVPVIKQPPFIVRLSQSIKEKLGVDYQENKHVYIRRPDDQPVLGSVKYEIFEKIE